ncbi:oxidoreductase [Chryseobacterium formosense]|uniref:Oxidoreductase n=1 Tax=Chryseobacterium formosense TaxID=236814 RepID=A0A085Z894_9FLAO|nr:SDR family NAD(P)-dependent oxidoreductase [Chryseobacterium formosense]KFF00658.1 oxidoreductase [Chryseobacterium formosense]SFT36249.1 NAD(P)-dependent dehydrogenase, short-chain alcohol dehydrogenase family [Chryseobacterium formosense]
MSNNNYQGALQQPINSGFNGASTSMEVIKGIDLTGKIAIVTGGYAGIGLETVKALTSAGATVIVPARDTEKAKNNLAGIANVELETMDLMDPVSIDSFAEKFMSSERPLHVLINNAGIMWVPLQRDSRGYESQLSTNHLGHFQLTSRLWKALVEAEGARVINISSWGHHYSKFNFEDPNFEKREYETLLGYGQSKTANILFSVELDNRGKDYGVRAYSLHPGAIVETDLKRHLTDEQLSGLGVYDENGDVVRDALKGLKTISQGASTTVSVATSPDLNEIGGVYCENNNIAEVDHSIDESQENFADRMTDIKKLSGVLDYALDETSAKELWILSENLTGVKFII